MTGVVKGTVRRGLEGGWRGGDEWNEVDKGGFEGVWLGCVEW